jgi:hypothetical protein
MDVKLLFLPMIEVLPGELARLRLLHVSAVAVLTISVVLVYFPK